MKSSTACKKINRECVEYFRAHITPLVQKMVYLSKKIKSSPFYEFSVHIAGILNVRFHIRVFITNLCKENEIE